MNEMKVTTAECEVITVANIKVMGEYFAMQALKSLMMYLDHDTIYHIYYSLLVDIHHANEEGYVLSDSYDIAQDAMCFLCQFIGHKLGDCYGKSARGKDVNIKTACYRFITNNLMSELRRKRKLERLEGIQPPYELSENKITDEDYDRVDETIDRMNLTKKQKETLLCYYNGMRYTDIAKQFSITLSSLCGRRQRIQKKYFDMIK